ncbi:MAG: hypothetical protein NT001_05815 [Candidatus Woesearchaeota archaeon]|nr:hypothetical protein [Candidatus Woesearchaeota archaeon]
MAGHKKREEKQPSKASDADSASEDINKILTQKNISLVLDSYDDIFSDFDPRPYSERALSDDFLAECRNASRDKKDGEIELRFLVPAQEREINDETKIKKRLKDHFQKHSNEKDNEQKALRKEGSIWFVIGAVLIFTSVLLYEHKGLIYGFLFVLLEPAGWFTMWTGLDKIFIEAGKKYPEIEFYKKMAHARMQFFDY